MALAIGLVGLNSGSALPTVVGVLVVLPVILSLLAIANRTSKAFQTFDEARRMRPSPLNDRIVDVANELMKFMLLMRDRMAYPVDRYSERKGMALALIERVNFSSAT